MIEQQLTILATILLENLQETSLGHCARVDYLGRQEAIELCQYLSTTGSHITLAARILVPSTDALLHGEFVITTDQAIELRNRKQSRVCLFVPDDMVDAAFSSLANSFELIDGRELHALVLKRMLADLPGQAQQIWRAIQQRLRRPLHVSVDRQLNFLAALSKLSAADRLEQAGREIWRVGLVVDARADFVTHLDKNRGSVLKLSRPGKIHSTTAERIRALGVNDETFTNLAAFFRNRALHDVVSWSHDLVAEDGPTLDQWVFPLEERSDILSVKIRPFIGPDGAVVSYCKLKQPDGPGGSLRASCGSTEKMVVRWVTEPILPANLDRWHVEMIPSGGESIDDLDLDLPATDINGSRRTSTIKLDLEFEEPPDFGLCIRVSALDAAGNTLQNDETGEPISAESDEFFLVQESGDIEHESRQTRRTVPTIAFGRLEVAIETRDEELAETQPQWVSQNEEYFTLRLNERRILNIATSRILVDIQRRVLADPRSGGSFEVNLDELRAIQPTDVRPSPLSPTTAEAWNPFLRARENFFGRFKKAQPRDTIEAADWTPELANTASRYGQTYRELLDDLVTKGASRPEIMAALAIDTVLLRVVTNDSVTEDALLLLPTHPLRSAWIAGYTQLLSTWETQILQQKPQERKELINLDMVRQLAPTNTPTFAFRDLPSSTFVFYQNLQFFYGIALPPDTPDPHRRLMDIAQMLSVSSHYIGRDARHPERLGDYLKRFWTTHSYTETLCVTLVNSDDGELFVEATKQLLQPISSTEESDPSISAPSAFQVTSYVEDRRNSSGEELAGIRLLQQELVQSRQSDHLLPSLTTTVRNARALYEQPLQDVHLTFVSDITRPRVVTVLGGSDSSEDVGSLALHGLITRLIPRLSTENGELRWLHKIVTGGTGRPEPHPAGAKYSDVLVELHGAIQRAGNYFLQGPSGARPALEVKIGLEQQQLLDRLHEHSDWVITLDRFFALDYYDSPNEAHLGNRARKYLLDYAPEFGESLGHKMMLTTNSRDEISVLLSRAMHELGFTVVDHSVRQLLHHLKTVSGHLALQALGSSTSATAAVGLGVVTAWLQSRGRLEQAVLVPVDMHPQLFSRLGNGYPGTSNRRCDLVLFALKRNIMEATFIEVKWRRGQTALDSLAEEMVLQMESSEQAIRERFFHDKRIDAALQRGALVNVLRFYFDRARRYNIFGQQFEAAYIDNLARIERSRVEFRPSYEGYIVSLEDEPRKPFSVGESKITVLTAQDFENNTEFSAGQPRQPVTVSSTNGEDLSTDSPSRPVE